MSAAFTPGPWRSEPTNSAKLTYVAVSAVSGSNNSTVVIGQCAGPDREANARLIAAAPDLLSESRSAWAVLSVIIANGWVPKEHLEPVVECRDNLRVALRKAFGEGEQS